VKPISLTKKNQSEADKGIQEKLTASGEIPKHIAIIMDGNGRWAKKNGNMRIFGHKAGVDSVRDITEACAQLGTKYLTLYAFSTENWCRPIKEVNALMKILVSSLRKEAKNLNKNDIRLESIGQIQRLPKICQRELREVKKLTHKNTRLQLTLALSYSGRWDIMEAVKSIGKKIENGEINSSDIDEKMLSNHLATSHLPDPDLMIRTSGEFRLSNFLLWQLAYAELFITETCWPEFRRDQLYNAIASYQNRERRFGKTSEQVNTAKNIERHSLNNIIS